MTRDRPNCSLCYGHNLTGLCPECGPPLVQEQEPGMPRIVYQIYRDDGSHVATGHIDTILLADEEDVRRAIRSHDSSMQDNARRYELEERNVGFAAQKITDVLSKLPDVSTLRGSSNALGDLQRSAAALKPKSEETR